MTDACAHDDIQPISGNEDWGRCATCGDADFPITERAAYGPVDCATCHDTGMVSVDVAGQRVTRKDGSASFIAYGFADRACPDCALGKRGTP